MKTEHYLNHSLFTHIQISLTGRSGWGKQAKVVWQTLGVSYRVSQRRESDTRPVCGDNEETEAQPQSHMKGIFGGFFGGSFSLESLHPSSRIHTRHHTAAVHTSSLSSTLFHTYTCSSWLPPPPLSDSYKDKASPWILWHNCCHAIFVCFSCCLGLFPAALSNCLSFLTPPSFLLSSHTRILSFSAFYLFLILLSDCIADPSLSRCHLE